MHFHAAGVAVPGLVRRNGTVWAPNLPGWKHMPLARLLTRRLRVPVVVESDRSAAVLGEQWKGAARGCRDAIVLIVGTGIGAGILSDSRLVRGAHELAGCAGWMTLSEAETAESRRAGWLESLVAGPAISRAAQRKMKPRMGITAEELARRARRGDRRPRRIFTRVGELLGLAAANLISLFDPEVIVLGGGLAGAADLYWKTLEQTARQRSQPLAATQVRMRVSRLGSKANILGVARLAWEAAARPRGTH